MGRVIHFEIQASQPQVLMDFYSAVFGWKFNKWGELDYWLIEAGAEDEPGILGALQPRPCPIDQEVPFVNAFVCTIQVDSIDEALEKSLAMGAVLQLPKSEVPGVGTVAYIKDPDGNLLCMLDPNPAMG